MGDVLFRAALRTRVCAAAVVLLVPLVGCGSGAPVAPPPTPVPAAASAYAVPEGGVTLAQLGFSNGPATLVSVPAGTRLGVQVDQPNMQTMTFVEPAGAEIGAWLEAHLPAAGFTITAATLGADGGIVFAGHGWDGAFTSSRTETALTLRRSAQQG